MATKYALQQIGVADGTKVPADQADGRQVNGRRRVIIASKPNEAWNSGDKIFLGKKPAGHKIVDIKVGAGVTLGTSTLDIGDATTVDKYVDGATVTTPNVMVSIGPKASTLAEAPADEAEDLWLTVGVANIAQATAASIVIELAGA